jgi:hypothetical protein
MLGRLRDARVRVGSGLVLGCGQMRVTGDWLAGDCMLDDCSLGHSQKVRERK